MRMALTAVDAFLMDLEAMVDDRHREGFGLAGASPRGHHRGLAGQDAPAGLGLMVIGCLADRAESLPGGGLQFHERRGELIRLGQRDERLAGEETVALDLLVERLAQILLPRMKGGFQESQVLFASYGLQAMDSCTQPFQTRLKSTNSIGR